MADAMGRVRAAEARYQQVINLTTTARQARDGRSVRT